MLTPRKRETEFQRLVLLVTGSWLLPVLLLCICALLFGCGGGDEEDGRKDTQPIDCAATPELCR